MLTPTGWFVAIFEFRMSAKLRVIVQAPPSETVSLIPENVHTRIGADAIVLQSCVLCFTVSALTSQEVLNPARERTKTMCNDTISLIFAREQARAQCRLHAMK